MTNDEGNVVKISSFTHTPLLRTSSKGEMWRRKEELVNWKIWKLVNLLEEFRGCVVEKED